MTIERHEQSDNVAEDILPQVVPVPPQPAQAIGYRGDARFAAVHWEPRGDDVYFDDGRRTGTGTTWAWLNLRAPSCRCPALRVL